MLHLCAVNRQQKQDKVFKNERLISESGRLEKRVQARRQLLNVYFFLQLLM